MLMLRREKEIIGLDIGSRYIKAAQLKEIKGSYQLEHLSTAPLLPELIVDGSIIDSFRVVEAIKNLFSSQGIKAKDVALSVSGHSSVIIKRVTLPQMTEDELSDSIKFEAEQYIPFDIEDVNLDFQILGSQEGRNQMDVLIVAVKKSKINEYVSVVTEAGLNPVIVDVDAFALENMYEINYDISSEENVALVNVGASTININILRGGLSVFTRDSSIGSNLHTESIQKEFSISYEEAERLKHTGVMSGKTEADIASALNAVSDDIISDISRSFDYFKGAVNQGEVNKIILSGGCVMVKGFPILLGETLGINVEIAEPLKNIGIPDRFDRGYLKSIAPISAVAIGLALRRVGDR